VKEDRSDACRDDDLCIVDAVNANFVHDVHESLRSRRRESEEAGVGWDGATEEKD
jgi:hypothetical protein